MVEDKEECKDECSLKKVKEEYKKLEKKYDLPSFSDLNKDFNVERTAEVETDFLLREMRRFISDKVSNYLRFVESLLNPQAGSLFIFSIIKTLNMDDKKLLEKVYKEIIEIEIKIIEVDVEYNEEKEAEFIKETYRKWQAIKKDILEIHGIIRDRLGSKFEANNKGYFG